MTIWDVLGFGDWVMLGLCVLTMLLVALVTVLFVEAKFEQWENGRHEPDQHQ